MQISKELLECVGLWLAEGDTKTRAEVTLTNNEFSIIKHFHKTLKNNFRLSEYNPRIYVYCNTKFKPKINIPNVRIKYYKDSRGSKPYYLYRVASVKLVKEWKKLVDNTRDNEKYSADILRGFFAGEGTVHTSTRNSRSLKIAQKKSAWLENLLTKMELNWKYELSHRSYIISGRMQLEKLAEMDIAALHPLKKQKFSKMLKEFKQYHYPKNYLKKAVYNKLVNPMRTTELAEEFKRTESRINWVLKPLSDENKIERFRVRGNNYWIRQDRNLVIISERRKQVLDLINIGNIKFIANKLNTDIKNIKKMVKELEKLGLIKNETGWSKINTNKKVTICS